MAFAPSEHDIVSRLASSAAERSASWRGRGRQGCSLLPSPRCICLQGLRLLSPFWQRSAMQPGRYLGARRVFWGVAVLCGRSSLCPVVLSTVTDPRCSRYCMAD
ncbi:hypothetical protein Nmel_007053 [Mimus melanotis]